MAVHVRTTRIDDGHYKVELLDCCRNCKGEGKFKDDYTCPVCQGHGMVMITKDITVSIKPFSAVTNPKTK